MPAFVTGLSPPDGLAEDELEVNIFPGSATPTIFRAREPFWLGSGFVADPVTLGNAPQPLPADTGFELELDGARIQLETEVISIGGRVVSRRSTVTFAEGLPPGWHRFTGRWYVDGNLVLSSDRSIEFVEA